MLAAPRSCAPSPKTARLDGYERRRPEDTLLHRVVPVNPAGGRLHDPVALGQVSRLADEWLSTQVARPVSRRSSATGPVHAAAAR